MHVLMHRRNFCLLLMRNECFLLLIYLSHHFCDVALLEYRCCTRGELLCILVLLLGADIQSKLLLCNLWAWVAVVISYHKMLMKLSLAPGLHFKVLLERRLNLLPELLYRQNLTRALAPLENLWLILRLLALGSCRRGASDHGSLRLFWLLRCSSNE